MAPPKEGPPPHHKYGSVDTSEEPASQCSLLPTSRWNINPSFLTTAGGQRRPPQQKNEDNLRDPQEERHISPRLAVAIVCGLAFLAGSGVSWSQSSGGRSRAAAASSGLFEVSTRAGIPAAETRPGEASSDVAEYADVVALEFTALNFYHVRDGKPGQDYPWLKDIKLIEPHRDTTLAVVGAREGFDYRWEVRAGSSSSGPGELGGVQSTATGAVTIVVLTQLDENVVVLEEVDEDGKVTNRLEETVMVKYVRREIRTLTDDEREEVLDAMFQLWAVRVDGGEGKEIYGEDYADVYAMNRLHHKASASRACNYFHDGMGFLVSHALLTNTFEFSLQRVNPKLTLPYWDFTIETTAAAGIEYDPDRPFTRTELLSPSWFGTVDLNDKMVKDGRWAYTEIPIAKDDITSDVYGKLRAPWGVNDRAYISRGPGEVCQTSISGPQAWPSCGSHYDLTTGNPAFYSWVWTSMASPHAPVHLWIGGNLDCGTMYNKIGALVGSDIAKTLAFMSNGHRKGLFLSNAWGCNRSALVDEKPHEIMSSDTCGCHGYDLTQGDDYKAVMALLAYVEFYIGGYSEDIQRQVVELLCNGVLSYGEQAQSSSPLDPMFWPMHGTMERLWQFAVLTGQVTDFTWPDEDMNVTLPDGTIDTQYVSSYEVCIGHRGSDVFPYGLLSSDVDTFEVKTGIRSNPVTGNELTNREVLASLDPRSNPLTYVYDTFKWEHCGPEGYDFDDAWRETVPSPRKQFYQRDEPRSTLYTSFKREMAELMKENHGSSFEEA